MGVYVRFDALCIDDSGRPESCPPGRWVRKGKVYTVTEVCKAINRAGELSFRLAEVKPPQPLEVFLARRFEPLSDGPLDEARKLLEQEEELELVETGPGRQREAVPAGWDFGRN